MKKVKEIIFEESSALPIFILENGERKKPCWIGGYVGWLTEAEHDNFLKEMKENKSPWWKLW